MSSVRKHETVGWRSACVDKGSPLGWSQPQPRKLEPPEQFTARRGDGSGADDHLEVLLGNVIVIALETPAGKTDRVDEVVQFFEAGITDEVRPPSAAVPPQWLVDEDHGSVLACISMDQPDDLLRETDLLRAAWRHLGGDVAPETIEMIIARHRQPARHYHTAAHVVAVLGHAERLLMNEMVKVDGDVVRAGALFHDVIYDPRSSTNEADSAAYAVESMRTLGWSADRLDLLSNIILATATHRTGTPESAVLLDADLAILGASSQGYRQYAAAVRLEYDFVDDFVWAAGRSAVLRSFLDRPQIFATATMRDEREAQARVNLGDELATFTPTHARDVAVSATYRTDAGGSDPAT